MYEIVSVTTFVYDLYLLISECVAHVLQYRTVSVMLLVVLSFSPV